MPGPEKFRIKLIRRKHKMINRDIIIKKVAGKIENPVDLENPDKILRIEVLGNFTGLSFHAPNEVIRFKKESN